jgi:uncharacterized protein (DUF305 family)
MQSRKRWAAGAIIAALLLSAAYFAGLLTPSLRAPGDSSAEAGFARDMSRHHAQAVAMSMIAWQNASTPEVRQLAYSIAVTQQAQIGMMSDWLKDWNLGPTGTESAMAWMPDGAHELLPDGRMPGMASTDEMNKLSEAKGKDVDILYCQLMLRHHLGGIHMVEGVLSETDNSRVRELAQAMKDGQQSEIVTLRDLLTSLGAQPLGS